MEVVAVIQDDLGAMTHIAVTRTSWRATLVMMLPALAQAMLVSDLALQLDLVVQVVVAPADLVVPLARLVVLQLGLLVQVVVKPAPADVADIFMRGKWDMIKRIIVSYGI